MTPPSPISLGAYVTGAAMLGFVVAASVAVAVVLLRGRRDLEPGSRAVAVGTLAVATLVLVHLVPGAFGVLGRGSVVLTAAIAVGVALLVARRLPESAPAPASPTADERPIEWLPAVVAAAVMLVFTCSFLLSRASTPIAEVDSLTFHLPQVVRWIQTETFWQIDNFSPGWAFGNYPNTGNVLELAVVLPWRDDAFVRLVNLPLLLLAGASVAVAARELGARRSAAVLAGAAATSVPALLLVSLNTANTDTAAYAGFAAGVAFLVRWHGSGRRGDLALAGVGLGLAFGTKWYGVSSVAVVVALWLAWRLARRGASRRDLVLDVAVLLAGSVVLGGYWLVRNLVLSGNPVFPVRIALGPLVLFDAPFDHMRARQGFSIAHYAGDASVLREYIWLGFTLLFGWPGALAALSAVAAGVLGRARRSPPVVATAVVVVVLAAVYVVTPYTAMGPSGRPFLMGAAARYAGPALVTAFPLLAWLASRGSTAVRRVTAGAAVLAVADGIRRTADLLDTSIGDVVTVRRAAMLSAAVVAAVVARELARRVPRTRALVAAGVAVAVVGGLLVGGRRTQERFAEGRYAGIDPVYDAVLDRAPSGARVGLAGEVGDVYPPALIVHGYRFGNRVVYVGADVDERLERHRDPAAFRRALDASGVRLLVVGLGSPPEPGRLQDEERWALAAGWEPVVRSGRLALLARP